LARQAHIGLGDTWRRKGDYARARAAYLAAMPSFPGPADEALRRGVLGRDAEAFLRGGEYDRAADTLRAWEFQLPVDRLTGQTALLWTQLHAAQRQWERVVVVAEALIKVNPDSAYAPQLLLQASGAYLKLGQPATATGALRRIVEHYPESALAQEVRPRIDPGR
jgi:TolA-binding protein